MLRYSNWLWKIFKFLAFELKLLFLEAFKKRLKFQSPHCKPAKDEELLFNKEIWAGQLKWSIHVWKIMNRNYILTKFTWTDGAIKYSKFLSALGSCCVTVDCASLPIPEEPGSNPVIGSFYWTYFLLTLCRNDTFFKTKTFISRDTNPGLRNWRNALFTFRAPSHVIK